MASEDPVHPLFQKSRNNNRIVPKIGDKKGKCVLAASEENTCGIVEELAGKSSDSASEVLPASSFAIHRYVPAKKK